MKVMRGSATVSGTRSSVRRPGTDAGPPDEARHPEHPARAPARLPRRGGGSDVSRLGLMPPLGLVGMAAYLAQRGF
jgi:hypothetical protein